MVGAVMIGGHIGLYDDGGVFAQHVVELTQQLADLGVSHGGRGHSCDALFALERHRKPLQLARCDINRLFDAAPQDHGIGTGRDEFLHLARGGLRNHRRGGATIAHLVAHMPDDMAHHHSAGILLPVWQLQHTSCDGRSIVQKLGLVGAFTLIADMSANGPQRQRYQAANRVKAAQHTDATLFS